MYLISIFLLNKPVIYKSMEHSNSDKSKSITQIARELRKNPTQPERKLWSILRNKQLGGYRFLRQKPIINK